jgi:hypothetical protein
MQRQNHVKYVVTLWGKYRVLVLKLLVLVCISASALAVGTDIHILSEECNDLA